jgi:hypothetical protein
MNDKSKPSPFPSAPPQKIAPDPAPNDLGHEGFENNIKQNTTDRGSGRSGKIERTAAATCTT